MTRRLLPALAVLAFPAALAAEEDGNKLLFEALGRSDCTVVPLWPAGVGPGETRPQLAEGFLRSPEGVILFRPVDGVQPPREAFLRRRGRPAHDRGGSPIAMRRGGAACRR
jgi:hypothetical protein